MPKEVNVSVVLVVIHFANDRRKIDIEQCIHCLNFYLIPVKAWSNFNA